MSDRAHAVHLSSLNICHDVPMSLGDVILGSLLHCGGLLRLCGMGLSIHGLVIVGNVAQVSPSAILLNHLAHAAHRLHAKQAVNEHQAVKGVVHVRLGLAAERSDCCLETFS